VDHEKFDVTRLERLNDERRFDVLPPAVMWSALGDPDPLTIVDIGAGTGLFARRFAELAPSAQIYAVDSAATMVEWMLAHVPASVGDRFHPLLAEESVVPLADAAADLVVMIHVHHELADPPASYREALRLLRPGGQVLVVDWAPGDQPFGPPQRIRASDEAIATMLEDAGFNSVTTHAGLVQDSLLTAVRP
jgi:ubiquinone/menaquinone biosynthesis C-methylase UbiE